LTIFLSLLLQIVPAVLLILLIIGLKLLNRRAVLEIYITDLNCSFLFMLFIGNKKIFIRYSLVDSEALLRRQTFYLFLHVPKILFKSCIQLNGEIRRLMMSGILFKFYHLFWRIRMYSFSIFHCRYGKALSLLKSLGNTSWVSIFHSVVLFFMRSILFISFHNFVLIFLSLFHLRKLKPIFLLSLSMLLLPIFFLL
jgi:hypothetical protein